MIPLKNNPSETITITELSKQYTYAKFAFGCAMNGCGRKPYYSLTRSNEHYCQSDLICPFHAYVWGQVAKIIGGF